MIENQSRYSGVFIIAWQLFLVASFPLQFISQRFYFYSLIAASAAFLLSKPWRFKPSKQQVFLIILLIGFVLLHVLSLLWTQDLKRGLKELETYSALLVLPILILWQNEYKRQTFLRFIKFTIVIFVFLLCLIAHSISIFEIIQKDLSLLELLVNENYHYIKLSTLVNLHPTYFGILIISALIILAKSFNNKSFSNAKKFLVFFLSLYLLVFLVLLVTRGPILGLIAILGWWIIIHIRKFSIIRKTVFIIAFLSLLVSIFVFEPLTKRFVNPVLRMITEQSYHFDDDSFSYHIRSWICAIQSNQNAFEILFGHGTGNEISTLIDCYRSKNFPTMVSQRLNAHCEYLTQYVKLGLIGVVYLIFLLWNFFFKGSNSSDSYLKPFVILIAVVFLFESALNVSKGVFFISFLFPYFYLLDKEKVKTST